jgi:hypothetical protein
MEKENKNKNLDELKNQVFDRVLTDEEKSAYSETVKTAGVGAAAGVAVAALCTGPLGVFALAGAGLACVTRSMCEK